MPYGLLVNGSLAELGDLQYLLSPQVLATPRSLPACRLRHSRLMRIGIATIGLHTQRPPKANDTNLLTSSPLIASPLLASLPRRT